MKEGCRGQLLVQKGSLPVEGIQWRWSRHQLHPPKLDKEMQIQDDLNDLTRLLAFKEKRILQAEAGWDYRVCEQVTKEIVKLNSRKHQLEEEKLGFEKNTLASARLALESDGSMGSSS